VESIKISDSIKLLDIHKIHSFLANDSTWALGISFQTIKRAIENSICIGAYLDNEQIGFCRIITDRATFGNLVDVIVWPNYRGLGVSKLLMEAAVNHPDTIDLRRFTLATSNAHGLYQQFGFTSLTKPTTFMERYNPDVYSK
jgi:N-acetylglutamate synthase-like GNAT family acetyltransferase